MDTKLFNTANAQVNAELYNSYLYLSLSLWSQKEDWPGLANWFYVQSQEELVHATTMLKQLQERGEAPSLASVAEPPSSWKNPLDAMQAALEAEKGTTERINNIASVALEVKDHAFYDFIMMFVREQVEEEDNVNKIIGQLKRIVNNDGLMYQLDATLMQRVFVNPFTGV